MCPFCHNDLDLVFGRQEFSKFNFDHQPDHLRHRTVRYGGSEMDLDFAILFDKASFQIDDIQLLQSQGIFRVVKVTN